jgi:hypothetical protein
MAGDIAGLRALALELLRAAADADLPQSRVVLKIGPKDRLAIAVSYPILVEGEKKKSSSIRVEDPRIQRIVAALARGGEMAAKRLAHSSKFKYNSHFRTFLRIAQDLGLVYKTKENTYVLSPSGGVMDDNDDNDDSHP